jgi:O-antigen ligase
VLDTPRRDQWTPVAIATVALLIAAILLGGASRLHALRLAMLEITALPLLVILVGKLLVDTEFWRQHRLSASILLGAAAIPLLQILPLPAAIWTALPGRSEVTLSLELASITPGWASISLTPEQTWRAFLAFLPPAAMFLAALTIGPEIRRFLIQLLLAFVVASVVVGILQLATGRLYLWPTTDPGNMVGFMANRNHFATLLLVSLPFAAAIFGRAFTRRNDASQITLWLSLAFIGLVVVSLGVIRSRTGILLAGPALLASFVIAWIAGGGGRPRTPLLIAGGAVVVVVLAVGSFAIGPIMERFDPNASPEVRLENWPTVLNAAASYLPLGSGMGSFDPVFRSVEPLETLDATYFNQAHNDYLEIWLEAGWLGAGLIIAFFVWYGRRSLSAWRSGHSRASDIRRAASIAILLILLHSFVDYPLRTETIAVLFAMCAAFLEGGPQAIDESSEGRRSRRRRT